MSKMEDNSIKENLIANASKESNEGESTSEKPVSQLQQQQTELQQKLPQAKPMDDESSINVNLETFTEASTSEQQQQNKTDKEFLENNGTASLSAINDTAAVNNADATVASPDKNNKTVDKATVESTLATVEENCPPTANNIDLKALSNSENGVENENANNDNTGNGDHTKSEIIPTSKLEEALTKTIKTQKRSAASANFNSEPNVNEDVNKLKMRRINVNGAPKMPATGYMRYMNERRESLRKEQPNKVLTKMELMKIIGEEWQSMSMKMKTTYMEAAALDKQKLYIEELNNFLKSHPGTLSNDLTRAKRHKPMDNQMNKKMKLETVKERPKEKKNLSMPLPNNQTFGKNEKTKRKSTPSPSPSLTASAASSSTNINIATTTTPSTPIIASTHFAPGEIPIFTNEFLEHNKIYDMELKTLRKSKIDLQQQNAALEKYVENMRSGLEKLVSENKILHEKNHLLEVYLDKLQRKLSQALHALPLPSQPSGANIDNINNYMMDLYKMSTTNKHGPAVLNKAKDIIRKLDLQIQF